MTGIYNTSCDYVIGCNYSGCSYNLTSSDSNINGSIIGKNYDLVSIDVNTQYNLTVADINNDMAMKFIVNPWVICSKKKGIQFTYWNFFID